MSVYPVKNISKSVLESEISNRVNPVGNLMESADKNKISNRVKVRFAPSPTGYLHIGSARTALYNWLFARHHKGNFLLRIEDTDKLRSEKRYLDQILESLKWLGIEWDGEPCFQSARLKLYREFACRLLDEDKAYKTENGAIKFKMPAGKLRLNDLVHGELEFDCSLLKDLVIIKSDGYPAYNFACVVDDIRMRITHIIRGDDHISNTPKQVALYQALGFSVPLFAHIPLIMGPDKTRLSKRHGAVSISQFRQEGYLPEALVNYIALLGWSPGNNREIIAINELVDEFSLRRVNKSSAIFDMNKLRWINGEYIKKKKTPELTDLLIPSLKTKGYLKTGRLSADRRKWLEELVELFKDRVKLLDEFVEQAGYFFTEKLSYDKEAVDKYLKTENVAVLLKRLKTELEKLTSFDVRSVEKCCRELAAQLDVPAARLIHPTRVALTGKMVTPGLFEVMNLLGKERVLKRLEKAIKMVDGLKKCISKN